MTPTLIFVGSLIFISIVIAWMGVKRVEEGTVQLVERFGRYHRALLPGINLIVPGVDRVKRGFSLYTILDDGKLQQSLVNSRGGISTKEEILDPPEFDTIAADNAVVHPDMIAYFRIIEPSKCVYGVSNLGEAMIKLLETTLRQEVGKMDSDTLLVSRDVVGARVQESLERASEAWGVKILRVEIQEIRFSKGVQENLTKAREAELSRRAQVVTAKEGRDTEILRAEGAKQAKILLAQGDYEAAKLKAEADYLMASKRLQGEAVGTKALSDALASRPEALIAIKALEAQAKVAESLGKSNNAMFIPTELVGLFGALGAIRRSLEVFNSKLGDPPSVRSPNPTSAIGVENRTDGRSSSSRVVELELDAETTASQD